MCGCTCKRLCWNCTLHNSCAQARHAAGVWTHSPAAQQCWESTGKSSGCQVLLTLMSGYLIHEARISSWTQMLWGGMETNAKYSHFLTYVMHSFEGRDCRRVAKVTALAALLKPVNWRSQGVKSIMGTGTSVTVLLHVIHQFKTGQREVQHWRTSAAIWHWQQPSKLWLRSGNRATVSDCCPPSG